MRNKECEKKSESEAWAQPVCDLPGTSPEGPLKVLTSWTSRGPSGDQHKKH